MEIRPKAFQIYSTILNLDWTQIYDPTEFEDIGLIVTPDYSLGFLLEKAQDIHRKGGIGGAYEILKQIYIQITRYTESSHPKLLGDYYLLFGMVQMQRGHLLGDDGAFSLALKSSNLFLNLNDKLKLAEAYQLIGICYLQTKKFRESIESYKKGINAIKGNKKFLYTEMRILHDLAHSLLHLSLQQGSNNLLEASASMFDKSNMFFKSESPDFHKIAIIRTAEMHVKSGSHSLSQEILDEFEDVSNYSSMILPHQALFLRINTERYLVLNKVEEASKFFLSALTLNQREGYIHQLQSLEKIFKTHKTKFYDVLPEDFNISL